MPDEAVQTGSMTEPHLPKPTLHAAHDLTLIAALAARTPDLTEPQMTAANEQLASCDACTALLADLVTLQTALPTTSTPPRPRDFSLTPADAERLRRTGWRRFLGLIGSARDNVSRPLAVGFTSLGVAGLLLASASSLIGGAGTQAILSPVGAAVEQAAPAPAASPMASGAAASAPAAETYGTDRMSVTIDPDASGNADGGVFSGAGDVAGDGALVALRDDASGLSVMFVVAGTLLLVGLGLFALRWSARRLL